MSGQEHLFEHRRVLTRGPVAKSAMLRPACLGLAVPLVDVLLPTAGSSFSLPTSGAALDASCLPPTV